MLGEVVEPRLGGRVDAAPVQAATARASASEKRPMLAPTSRMSAPGGSVSALAARRDPKFAEYEQAITDIFLAGGVLHA